MGDEGDRTLVAIRWDVWPFYAKDKPQFLTNARVPHPVDWTPDRSI